MRRSAKLEFFKLLRDIRLYVGTVLLLLLLWYGFDVRQAAMAASISAMDMSRAHQKRQYQQYISFLDSVINHNKQVPSYAGDPRNPVYYSQRVPQFAHMCMMPLAILSHGQSDLYNEEVLLNARFRDPRQQKQDMANPILLRAGQYDAAIVLVVLLPLFIIILSFDFLSAEKENGTLRLIAIQAGNLKKWLWAKTMIYGLAGFLIPWLICIGLFTVYDVDLLTNYEDISLFTIILLGYSFFWQLLAVLINSFGRGSAFNALTLVCLWVFFVFVMPAASNLVATEISKVPSRVSFINSVRLANVEAEKLDSSQLIDKYFFDHPELAEKKDTVAKSHYSDNDWWKEVVMSQEIINRKADPIYNVYSKKLKAANRMAGNMAWLSPAGIFNKGLLQLSGTSSQDYFLFSDSAMQYREKFLSAIRDKILLDKEMSYDEVIQHRLFTYQAPGLTRLATIIIAMLLYLFLVATWIKIRVNRFNI